jgi:hypothetical protein
MGGVLSSFGSNSELSKYYIEDQETLGKLFNKKRLNEKDLTCRYVFEFNKEDGEFINLYTITPVNNHVFNSNSKYLITTLADKEHKKYIKSTVPALEESDKDKIFLVYDYRKDTCEFLKKNGRFEGNKYKLFYIIGEDSTLIPLNGLYYLCDPESIINKTGGGKKNIKIRKKIVNKKNKKIKKSNKPKLFQIPQ